MICIQGVGISPGLVSGTLYFHRKKEIALQQTVVKDRDAEWQRFLRAQARALEQLDTLAEQARRNADESAAAILEGHRLLAEDPDLTDGIKARIMEQGLSAETAIVEAGTELADDFAALEDPYLQARAADVKDVSSRIAACTAECCGMSEKFPKPVILAADDLSPSETAQLDRENLLALITAGGSANGHTAILARTMGIPAVIGAAGIMAPELDGKEALVDGEAGRICVEPDQETKMVFEEKRKKQLQDDRILNGLRGKTCTTSDGQSILVCCNINTPADVAAVLENDADGVGLFRSEFLYIGRDCPPDEETQFEAYRTVLSAMGDKEVIIRTLDIGADKQIEYFDFPKEENPALGNRALRFQLTHPDLFWTQLRALYRASAYGRLGIMFPMVANVWEVQEARNMCKQVQQELRTEKISFSEQVRIGIMVETPAAALISDRLAQMVDFFSCGTNDLTQYTLACDRQNRSLGRFCDPHHPAVLRLLKLVTDNAHKYGIQVGICGELAGDPSMTETFLAMGIDELSVSPRSVLPLRRKIRATDISALRSSLLDTLMSDRSG